MRQFKNPLNQNSFESLWRKSSALLEKFNQLIFEGSQNPFHKITCLTSMDPKKRT